MNPYGAPGPDAEAAAQAHPSAFPSKTSPPAAQQSAVPAELQPEVEERPAVMVTESEIGGDVNIALRDLYVTKYVQGLAHLRPRPLSRGDILRRDLFEPPGGFRQASLLLKPEPGQGSAHHVLVLVTERGTGGRTTALRLLDDSLPDDARLFELLPDWEKADVALIPEEPNTGYLLNLAVSGEFLSAKFREQLTQYASRAKIAGTWLVVLVSRAAWGMAAEADGRTAVAIAPASRPSAAGVVERRLLATPATADRVKWLSMSESVFFNLLTPETAPGEAERLAGIIARATGADDDNARAEYQNWEGLVEQWFSGDEDGAARSRALRIAGAFLDRCSARVVLDAADQLLAMPQVNWPTPVGGPLAGPDARSRCADADLAFRPDGTASISQDRPGIDHALLRHVWHTRPQLVPVLKEWLGQISATKGIAEPHRERLAESLTTLAESEGPTTILDLVEQWLAQDGRKSLAVNVLDDLAVHPVVGAAVRDKLRNWAKGKTQAERQHAVVEVCGRKLGSDFPHIALTRLRYVLDQPADEATARAALNALASMLREPALAAQVLNALVDWMPEPESEAVAWGASAMTFVALLDLGGTVGDDNAEAGAALLLDLLSREGAEGEAIRKLLTDGWRAAWRNRGSRPSAALALDSWCRAAEAGKIPAATLRDVISVVFEEEADSLGDDLNHILGGDSELRRGLRHQYAQAIRDAMAARARAEAPI
ncbi:hypothetical protein [Kitasatospora sp. NPDC059673]|uniref:hypothetical protein n=1 Tax=Kitasatospora sp. NPDC059673 TaxID=3346901 RepID=UPI00368B4350